MNRLRRQIAATLVPLAALAPAYPAEWSFAPDVALAVDYDSNRNLSALAMPSAATAGTLHVILKRATETLALFLEPQLSFQRYSNREFERTDDRQFGGGLNWLGERSALGISARWNDQSVVTAERLDTGIVDFGARRRTGDASASWSWYQSERRAMSLAWSIQDTRYVDNANTVLQNNRYTTISVDESVAISDRTSINPGVSLTDLVSPGELFRTRALSASLGYRKRVSERLNFDASAGVTHRSHGPNTDRGFVGSLKLSYAHPLGSVELSMARSNSPSGFGLLTEHDEALLRGWRGLSDRWTLSAAGSLYRNRSIFSGFQFADRSVTEATLALSWQATPEWSLSGQALVARARGAGAFVTDEGDGWQLRLQAHWSPNRRSISR